MDIPPRRDSWAWLPPSLTSVVAVALIVAIAILVRVLFRLRDSLSLTENKMWILVAGIVLIEAYLGRRAFLEGRRALASWRRR
jgi:hypothetical protein